jgi:hypothetical protein
MPVGAQRRTYATKSVSEEKYQEALWEMDWPMVGERTRRNRLLGPVPTMRKSEARAKLDAILAPINQEQAPPSGEQRLRAFVEGTYYQFYLRKWKKSTAMALTGSKLTRYRPLGVDDRDALFLHEVARVNAT